MTARSTIDVSHLPATARDSRSPAWWGNTLFMLIETTTVALLLASYFYLWRNYPQSQWPPSRVDSEPPLLNPVPDLLMGGWPESPDELGLGRTRLLAVLGMMSGTLFALVILAQWIAVMVLPCGYQVPT
jgi:hypothetical protein